MNRSSDSRGFNETSRNATDARICCLRDYFVRSESGRSRARRRGGEGGGELKVSFARRFPAAR